MINKLNQGEALRYMGYGVNKPDEKIKALLDECEKNLLSVINPKYIYKVFDIEISPDCVLVLGTTMCLRGKDITEHLNGCTKCVLLAVTLSQGADRIIRQLETEDMTKAVVTDCLASSAVEQVCNSVDEEVRQKLSQYSQTWRFSPGYGDLPLDVQNEFLTVLDAQKRIGLNATENNILTPRKSVTAVIGLSKDEISKGRRGCASCNMKEVCQFRIRGEHCGIY